MTKLFLWFGPIHREDLARSNLAVSPAASHWQKNFFNELEKQLAPGHHLNYLPQRYFPRGPIFSKSERSADRRLSSLFYVNLPLLRDAGILFSALRALRKVKVRGCYFFTYNSGSNQTLLGAVVRALGGKWVAIVAEGRYSRIANFTLFLSHSYCNSARIGESRKQWFPGGVSPLTLTQHDLAKRDKIVLLYAGGDSPWTGLSDLIELFGLLTEPNFSQVQLEIYGLRDPKRLRELSRQNSRIHFFGLVPQVELHDAMARATFFVNPRPEGIRNGSKNFPSKLLTYLTYPKPILSTRSPSLGPIFDTALDFFSSPSEFKKVLSKLIALDRGEMEEKTLRLVALGNELQWSRTVGNLLETKLLASSKESS